MHTKEIITGIALMLAVFAYQAFKLREVHRTSGDNIQDRPSVSVLKDDGFIPEIIQPDYVPIIRGMVSTDVNVDKTEYYPRYQTLVQTMKMVAIAQRRAGVVAGNFRVHKRVIYILNLELVLFNAIRRNTDKISEDIQLCRESHGKPNEFVSVYRKKTITIDALVYPDLKRTRELTFSGETACIVQGLMDAMNGVTFVPETPIMNSVAIV